MTIKCLNSWFLNYDVVKMLIKARRRIPFPAGAGLTQRRKMNSL